MTDIQTEDIAPVAHEHDGQEHSHEGGDQPHGHEDPPAERGYVPDPGVQAFVTTVTLSVAHTNDTAPYEVVKHITAALESINLRGVVAGVSAVELRGDGGLIGL